MSDIKFTCLKCKQSLEAPEDMMGQLIDCPSCGQTLEVPKRNPTLNRPSPRPQTHPPHSSPRFPIVINASPRALYAYYVRTGTAFLCGLLLCILLTSKFGSEPGGIAFIVFIWAVYALLLAGASFILWIKFLRISNTKYSIYPNKIEASSYTFRFMGVHNNVVNLKQLRQIHASVNSYLDLWFFFCGHVSITVSGDVTDFVLENVYKPGQIRRQIEEIVFGKDNVQQSGATPEVGEVE